MSTLKSMHRFTPGKPAIKPSHKGRLHANLGVPAGQKIPAAKLETAKHSKSPAIRKQANFAANARKWKH